LMDNIIGLDIHAVIIPPAPAPIPTPHPYMGPIYLWHSPKFPMANVLIQGMPACATGAMGYFPHIPFGLPGPTAANSGYWKRYLLNIPKALMLVALTLLANLAISAIASLIPKPPAAEAFIKDVTGVDTSSKAAVWETIKGSFMAYTKWQTWVKLLMPPIPFPCGQGSSAIGSPNVTVNGGPLAFCAPLMGTSCSDIPIVPNAVVLGFSTVMVGVTFSAMLRGIAVNAAQGAVGAGVGKGVAAVGKARAGRNH
jgi:hypothetical protein